jgi:hypothetical protein
MIRFILGIFLIILIASLIGIDSCTCGQGPQIRSNIKSLFQGNMKEEKNINK